MRRLLFLALIAWSNVVAAQESADLILHNGKVVTVDAKDTIAQAIAIGGGKILLVGDDGAALKLRGPKTEVIDLGGKTVLPGLIDSHVHPSGAAMFEFDHPIPEMNAVQDVLNMAGRR